MNIEEYSEKAIVVRGNTTPHTVRLTELGGTFNARLKNGPGWIYSKKRETAVREFIASVADTSTRLECKTSDQFLSQLDTILANKDLLGCMDILNKVFQAVNKRKEKIVLTKAVPKPSKTSSDSDEEQPALLNGKQATVRARLTKPILADSDCENDSGTDSPIVPKRLLK